MRYIPKMTIRARRWENCYWKIKQMYVKQSAATDRIIRKY